eukprot:scaffold140503_cov118-Phaeocystis_antarctica.AAC.1
MPSTPCLRWRAPVRLGRSRTTGSSQISTVCEQQPQPPACSPNLLPSSPTAALAHAAACRPRDR